MTRLRPRTSWREHPGDVFVGLLVAAGLLVVIAGFAVAAQSDTGTGWGWASPTPPSATSAAPTTPAPRAAVSYLLAEPRPAPPIELVDPNAAAFSLSSLRGNDVLVFFGYTHCPDVCPATIGVVGQVLASEGSATRAVFVTVDPERDTTTSLRDYSQYLPAGFTALTGTDDQIRTTAAAWGIRYARVDTGTPGAYSMMHTADVFLVDATGEIRAEFPFGTGKDEMVATIDSLAPVAAASTPVTSPPAASPTPVPTAPASVADLIPDVVSTSVWAGPETPVILALRDPRGPLNDPGLTVHVEVQAADGSGTGISGGGLRVQPPGVADLFYVVTLHLPAPGQWRLLVTASAAGSTRTGSVNVTALDPGETAAIGLAAPTVHTPTLNDAGGDARAVTTDPQPDLRLSMHSTTDALAAHRPFVLVIDSPKFRVSPVCGKAVIMARYLADRWPAVDFIHLEPFVYTLVSETPVLSGDLEDPPVSPAADDWGIAAAPWGGRSMPWVFVVDGNGIVRAKYQGLMGSNDVDVLLAALGGGS